MRDTENNYQKSKRIHKNCVVIFLFICKLSFGDGCKLLLELRHLAGHPPCCCNGEVPLLNRPWRQALLFSVLPGSAALPPVSRSDVKQQRRQGEEKQLASGKPELPQLPDRCTHLASRV